MSQHDDASTTPHDHIADLLADATALELLRLAFQAGHAAAQGGSFSVADRRLQAVLDRISRALRPAPHDEERPSGQGTRSGGEW